MLTLFRNLFSPPRHMILLFIATWIGLSLAEKRAERHGISKDDLNNITFYALIAFVIGGRLSFVLQNMPAFIKSPLGIISINPDIFDPLGALAVAIIVAFIYGQRHGLLSLEHTRRAYAILCNPRHRNRTKSPRRWHSLWKGNRSGLGNQFMECDPPPDSNLRDARFALNLWAGLVPKTESTPGHSLPHLRRVDSRLTTLHPSLPRRQHIDLQRFTPGTSHCLGRAGCHFYFV